MKTKVLLQPILVSFLVIVFPASFSVAADKKVTPDEQSASRAEETPQIIESLVFEWPDDEKWVEDYHYQGEGTEMQLYFPKGQSSGNWEEMLTQETVYGKSQFVVGLARQIYLGTVKGSPDATWDIISKGKTDNNHQFVIFEIICPDFLSGEPPQVQLWKLIRGKTAMFNLQYSYRDKEMPDNRREKILEMLEETYIKAEKP